MNLKIARLTSHCVGEMTCYCYAVTPARLLIRLAACYACLKQFCFASQALDRKVTADGIYFTDFVTIWPNLHILIGCHLENSTELYPRRVSKSDLKLPSMPETSMALVIMRVSRKGTFSGNFSRFMLACRSHHTIIHACFWSLKTYDLRDQQLWNV